ncbi:MAG: class I SAM-dependent methyltransferase [Dehalococcoidia bacterium]|nr:class I SAM-dependent methyltransferase [Dehalococcoidia bacterium]
MSSPRSRVEVGPAVAQHYDFFMNVILLGYYPHLIRKVINKMDLQPELSILDFGSGTGRNDCLMARKIGPEGHIMGLDISKEMLNLSRKRCHAYPNIEFREQRIEMPLAYQEKFDRVFTSFVLHGFEDTQKIGIVNNAYNALKPGGVLCIFDYNEFDLERLWFPIRRAFIRGECQLASEFLKLDLKKMLSSQGFTTFKEELFLGKHLRLLKATK